ncbi:MAG: DUF6090 family protein [Bacteroidota bacterium]
MTKFFRNIRKSLLSESRFSKYLLYASGEIILVVIGILIALQINNWNNNKLDQKQACVYLSNLLIDLEEQVRIVDNQFGFEYEAVLNGEALLNAYLDNRGFNIDEDFSKRLSILNNRMTFKIANSTFDELLASGNTNLIANATLKSTILDYFKDLERDKLVLTQNNEYIDNHFAPMALEISTHYMPNLQIKGFKDIIEKGYLEKGGNKYLMDKERAFKIIERKLRSDDYELRLLNEVNYRYRIAAVHLGIMDEIKVKTERLIHLIQEEQKKCP